MRRLCRLLNAKSAVLARNACGALRTLAVDQHIKCCVSSESESSTITALLDVSLARPLARCHVAANLSCHSTTHQSPIDLPSSLSIVEYANPHALSLVFLLGRPSAIAPFFTSLFLLQRFPCESETPVLSLWLRRIDVIV